MEPRTDFAKVMPASNVIFDLPQAVLASMKHVEIVASEDPSLHGTGKLLLFKRTLREVLNFARDQQIINDETHQQLSLWVTTGSHLIEGMVEAFISVSKNPAMLQLSEDVKAGCAVLCKKAKK